MCVRYPTPGGEVGYRTTGRLSALPFGLRLCVGRAALALPLGYPA
jgi:hypothetical protein